MPKEIPVVEQRYQAVLAVLEDGLTVTEEVTVQGRTLSCASPRGHTGESQ
jgi:hypothetical protein